MLTPMFNSTNGTLPELLTAQRPFIWACEFLLDDHGRIEWLVDGVIPRGYVTLFVGDGGVGKSLLALHLAISLSAGRTQWIATPTCGGNVRALYVDAELSAVVQSQRYAALDMRGESGAHLAYAQAENFSNENGFDFDALRHVIQRESFELVVLDSIGWLVRAPFEEPAVARELMGQLQSVAASTHAAVVAVHHRTKSGTYAGSSYVRHAVRSMLEIQQTEATENTTYVELRLSKSNFGASSWIRNVAIQFGESAIKIYPSVAGGLKGKIAELLGSGQWLSTVEIHSHIRGEEGVSKSAVERALREMYAAKLVARMGEARTGFLWQLRDDVRDDNVRT